jgi:hypothetical protein
MKKSLTRCPAFLSLLGFLFLVGCAGGSRTYLFPLSYDLSSTPPLLQGVPRPVTLALYQFEDARPDLLYLGRRVYRDGRVDYFKPDGGTVEQVVTRTVAKIMTQAGFKVTLVNRILNPEKEDFKNIQADVALGGKIEALWVEAKTGLATTDTEAKMRLKVFWGIPKERVWLTKFIEGSTSETDRPLWEPKYAQAKLNEVFRDGLNKLLTDEELKEKLKKLK